VRIEELRFLNDFKIEGDEQTPRSRGSLRSWQLTSIAAPGPFQIVARMCGLLMPKRDAGLAM
jgi:hypothetical protein